MHRLFAPEIKESHQIYSPRKFVGVPDGGIAISPLELNMNEMLSKDASSFVCICCYVRKEM